MGRMAARSPSIARTPCSLAPTRAVSTGGDRLADRDLQAQRGRSPGLPRRCPQPPRQPPPRQPDRPAHALGLRQSRGLKTALTDIPAEIGKLRLALWPTADEVPSRRRISSATSPAGGHFDRHSVLARVRLFENIELALQRACRHEMAAALRQVFGEEVPAARKVDQPYFRSIADDLAIGSLECRAGDDPRLLLGVLTVEPGGRLEKPLATEFWA